MKLSKVDRIIISDLFKSNEGLFVFTLHSRYKLSPKVLFESIKKLEAEQIVKLTEDRVFLTKDGINFAVSKNIYSSKGSNNSLKIQENFVGPRIQINSFYIPQDFN